MQIEKMRAFIIRVLFYCIILGLAYAVLKYALPFLMPFLVAFLIAFILKPVINWVTQKTKLGRKPVSVLLLIAFYVLAAALITVLGTRLVIFCRDIFYALPQVYDTVVAPALNSLQDTLENWVMALNPTLTDFVESAGNSLSSSLSSMVTAISTGALSAVTNVAGSVPSFLVKFIITIVASFFFVSDYYAITSFLARQLPQKARDMLFKVKEKGVDVIFKFGRAYAILLSITFVELLIGFSLLRVDYALLIALLTAIVDILPVLGGHADSGQLPAGHRASYFICHHHRGPPDAGAARGRQADRPVSAGNACVHVCRHLSVRFCRAVRPSHHRHGPGATQPKRRHPPVQVSLCRA